MRRSIFRCADLIILSCSFESVYVPLHVWSFVFFGSVVVLVSWYFTSMARASGKGSQVLRDPTLLSTNCGQRELVCTQRVHVTVRQSWERMLRTGRVCRSSEQPDDASPTIAICVCLDHKQHQSPVQPKDQKRKRSLQRRPRDSELHGHIGRTSSTLHDRPLTPHLARCRRKHGPADPVMCELSMPVRLAPTSGQL